MNALLSPEQARPPRWPFLFVAALFCNLAHIPLRALLHFIWQDQILPDQFGLILLAAHAVAVPFLFGALVTLFAGEWNAGRVGCFVIVFACSLSFLTAPSQTQAFALLILPLWPFLIYGGQKVARKWWTTGVWKELTGEVPPTAPERRNSFRDSTEEIRYAGKGMSFIRFWGGAGLSILLVNAVIAISALLGYALEWGSVFYWLSVLAGVLCAPLPMGFIAAGFWGNGRATSKQVVDWGVLTLILWLIPTYYFTYGLSFAGCLLLQPLFQCGFTTGERFWFGDG